MTEDPLQVERVSVVVECVVEVSSDVDGVSKMSVMRR